MSDSSDRETQIRELAGPIVDRVEYVTEATDSDIENIDSGVFFVMAFWSGPARQAFLRLCATIDELDPGKELRLVVADADDVAYPTLPFVENCGGWGECVWVYDGEIVADSGRGPNLECIGPNTKDLLRLLGTV